MLTRMDERLRAVPEGTAEWLAIEKKADEMVARIEATRDLTQHIVHCDLDMFYAAVELKRDPSLKGKCFGVGKGVLVTASYEARAFGVRSGMASHIAYALCPHLITVPNDMQSYVAASREIMAIFARFDSNLAQASLDEAYLNITDFCRVQGIEVDDAVAELRRQVREETGLTVSVGVASNKMLAKIGSDKNKPDGQFLLPATRSAALDFMHSLPIRKVPGVGRVTERMLQALGVETCGDIWRLRVRIALVLGDASLEWLLRYHLGIASSVVEPSKRHERKSVGREHTFKPTNDVPRLFALLRESAEQVERDLQKLDFVAKKVTLICKYDNFQRFTRDQTQDRYVSKADEIYRVVKTLLDHELKVQPGLTLRLIGARVGTLKDVRKPADGGPLKKFWADRGGDAEIDVPSAQPRHGDGGDVDGDDDEALRLAMAASLDEYQREQRDAERLDEDDNRRASSSSSASWSLSPPAERSAANLPSALWRSTPELLCPPPPTREKSEHVLRMEEELRGDIEQEKEQASENGLGAAHSVVRNRSSSPTKRPAIPPPTSSITSNAQTHNPSPPPPPSSLPPLICPICSLPVTTRFGSTLAGRNAQLNQHIDECLRRSGGEQGGGGQDGQASAGAGAKSTSSGGGALDRFFRRGGGGSGGGGSAGSGKKR